jgi:hypothetical protein
MVLVAFEQLVISMGHDDRSFHRRAASEFKFRYVRTHHTWGAQIILEIAKDIVNSG